MKGNKRQQQKEMLKEAIVWLNTYPDNQAYSGSVYTEPEEIKLADWIAAFLETQLKNMPNET